MSVKRPTRNAQRPTPNAQPPQSPAEPAAAPPGQFVSYPGSPFELYQPYPPAGDQPAAIAQ
ncbi:MAG: hypothetical protein FWG56_00940, partial [Desulfovibrionaceae bacterium]|nr:hypothetical protein [Desulfovibrionaceae bacterium]